MLDEIDLGKSVYVKSLDYAGEFLLHLRAIVIRTQKSILNGRQIVKCGRYRSCHKDGRCTVMSGAQIIC